MLAYAANRPRIAARQSSPNTLLFIICGHIVLIAAVMSARMGIAPTIFYPPTTIVSVPIQKPPPPTPVPTAHTTRQTATPQQAHEQPDIPRTATNAQIPVTIGGSVEPLPIAGTNRPTLPPLPPVAPASSPAVPLTPAAELKPPYPESKLLAGEEAALTLRLTVDEHGRVVAVDPIGRADPVFLSAARKHLIAHWRYKPALQEGNAVVSTVVITLHFELDD